jgi:hypothetical protein
MGTRHPNHRRIKTHLTYSIEELALLFSLHKNTVRKWQKDGLTPIDDGKPILFKGSVVASFLKGRRYGAKKPCGINQIFCLPCREPKMPDAGMVEYLAKTEISGNLRGICPECGRLMHRRMRYDQITKLAPGLDVSHTHALPHIREAPALPVKCDDGGAGKSAAFASGNFADATHP